MIELRPLADATEKQEVELLLARCDVREGLELPVAIPEPGALPDGGMPPLIYRQDGEIRGFLLLEGWPIPEGTPLVHPEHRLKGIGRTLVEAATQECRKRGLKRWMMVGEEQCEGCARFAEHLGARFDSREYRMELVAAELPARPVNPDGLTLERVSRANSGAFARTLAAAFDDPVDQVVKWSAEQADLPNVRLMVCTAAGNPAGTARLITVGFDAYVTAISVLPAFRRRGIGRWIVLTAVHDLLEEGWEKIRIEVDTANEAAHRLYRQCGFRESRIYTFYEIRL